MIDKFLRAPKDQALAPIALCLAPSIQPIAVTVAAFGVGVIAGLAVWQQAYSLGAGLWLLNRGLDGLDGTLARLRGAQSDFGGYLDMLLDTIIYALVPLALVLSMPSPGAWLALVALLISFYINYASWMYLAALLEKRSLGAQARHERTTITMPAGIVEGAETVMFYTLFLLLPGAAIMLFWIMAALVLVTVGQRLVWAARHLQS